MVSQSGFRTYFSRLHASNIATSITFTNQSDEYSGRLLKSQVCRLGTSHSRVEYIDQPAMSNSTESGNTSIASAGATDQLFQTNPISCAIATGATAAICNATPCNNQTVRVFRLLNTNANVGSMIMMVKAMYVGYNTDAE